MEPEREERAPVVDAVESLGLLVVPAVSLGLALAALGRTENLVAGLLVGGLFGAMLVGLRRGFYAVRTEDGVERRVRGPSEDSEENPWVRAANVEYDEKYDRILSVVLAAVGLGAFALVPFVRTRGRLLLRLVLLGLVGLTTSLVADGTRRS